MTRARDIADLGGTDLATQVELDASLYSDVGVRQDIITLALKEGVAENSTKFNLTNSSVVQFQADADFNLAGSTTTARNASEYISTSPSSTTNTSSFAPPLKQITTHSDAPSTSSYTGGGITNDLMGVGVGLYTSAGIDYGWDLATDWHFRGWYTASSNSGAVEGIEYPGGSVLITTDTSKAAGTTPSSLWDSASTNVYWIATPTQWADLLNTSYASTISASGLTDYYTHSGTSTPISHNLSSTSGQGVVRHYYNNGSDFGGLDVNYDASASTMTIKAFTPTSTTAFASNGQVTITNISSTGRAYITMGEAGGADDRNWSTSHLNGSTSDYSSATVTTPTVEAAGTALGTTNVPSSAVTKVSGVMLLKHAYGANTLGTDVKVYFTANNSAWTEASSYTDAGTFSTGIKMIKLGETTCTSGSDVRWKVVWANQVISSKEGHIYGIGLNY